MTSPHSDAACKHDDGWAEIRGIEANGADETGTGGILKLFRSTRRLSVVLQAGGALLVVGLATVLHLTVPLFATHYPLLLLFVANAVNAFLWRRPVALVGVLAGLVVALLFVIKPSGTLMVDDVGDVIAASIFATAGFLEVIAISKLLRLNAEREAAVRRARKAEADRALLMAESHHRIKNDLQLIASFLKLEAGAAREPAAATLRAAADRVFSVGQIHEQLSRNDGHAVDIDRLMKVLCTHLAKSAAAAGAITLSCRSQTRLKLHPSTATAIVLLVNELVINAIKHAFPDQRSGKITVTLNRKGPAIHLRVTDDGCGLNGDPSGMGRRFMTALTTSLDAELRFEVANGTVARLSFTYVDAERTLARPPWADGRCDRISA